MESGGASVPVSGTPTPKTTDSSSSSPKRTIICVYCGASAGFDSAHVEAARALARVMAANNIGLVYGGGTVGLMGEVAKTLVSLSGPDSVHGIIPEALVRYERDPQYTSTARSSSSSPSSSSSSAGDKQQQQQQQQEAEKVAEPLAVPEESVFGRTTVVADMHTRKRMMAQEVISGGPGSGFVALSGGYGTLEELFETMTWNQLGIHNRGIVVLNINGFYDGILSWINKSVEEGFIQDENKKILVEAKTAEGAIEALRNYKVSDAVFKLTWNSQ